jgi:hypothetical protein
LPVGCGVQAENSGHDGGPHILYNKSKGEPFYDADGSGAVAAMKFASVAAGTALSASDLPMVASGVSMGW